MIGLIVTGHGNFATGLTSGLKLLAGEPEYYQAVDFEPEDSIDSLTGKLEGALDCLKGCEGVLMLADLTGGSPFNVSSRLKMKFTELAVEVVGGTNLPLVLDAYMSRTVQSDVSALAASSMEAAKGQIVCFAAPKAGDDDCECEEYEE